MENTFATVMAKEIFFTECHSSVRRLDVKMQLEKKCQWPCVTKLAIIVAIASEDFWAKIMTAQKPYLFWAFGGQSRL